MKKLRIWLCKYLGWHSRPKDLSFDGVSLHGNCPSCEKSVMRDSQGNWF